MNNVHALLSQCRRLGAEFRTTPEGKLQVRTPAPLPDQLQKTLEQRKAEVIAFLFQQNNVEPCPYLDENGLLIIPFEADEKYHWWAGGQSLRETLLELGATPDILARYVEQTVTVEQ